MDYQELYDSLEKNKFDLIINWTRPDIRSRFCVADYKSLSQYVILPVDHVPASHTSLSRADLKNENMVHVKTSEEMLIAIYNEYAKSGFVPTFSAFPEDMESMLMSIASGMGISIMPDYDLHLLDGFPTLKAVPLKETWDRFQIVICWNKENSNPAAKLFIQYLGTVLN